MLARLIHFGAEIIARRGAVVLQFGTATWEELASDRRQYVLKALARYRSVYAAIGGERASCQDGEAL